MNARVEELLGQMTQEEKLAYVGGDRDFFIRPIPRLGIPEIKFADGPAGCRNWGPSTAYPAAVGLAASFDEALASQMGRAMARDCRARGVHVLLAPGVNLQRSPLTGRNFEYFGEDPLLAGRMATSLVRAVQDGGVAATVKHFVANNQEWDRNNVSSEVDEQVLREVYFPAFEMVVREGNVKAVMTSYNLVNGVYASHHPWLLKKVLKDEWGFPFMVMSDWGAVHDPVGGAVGGCDLEMPSAVQMSPANLERLLGDGTITQAEVDEKVRRILRTIVAAGFLDREQQLQDVPLDDPSSRAVALNVAREAMVLLKNASNLLPLDPAKTRKLAVVGPNAHPAVHGGSGSSYVTPLHSVSIREGLVAVAPNVEITHHPGIRRRTRFSALGAAVFEGPVKEELFDGQELGGNPVIAREVDRIDFDPPDGEAPAEGLGHEHYSIRWTGTFEATTAGTHDVMTNSDDGIRVFIDGKKVLDDWSDHAPRTTHETTELTEGRHEIVVEYFQGTLGAIAQFGIAESVEGDTTYGAAELERVAREADAVVVCVGFGQSEETNSMTQKFNPFWPPGWARKANLVESEDSDRDFALPAPQLETLTLVANANPNTIVVVNAGGGLSFDGWLDHISGLIWAWYPGQEGGTAIGELVFGQQNPSGKLPITLARRYEDHPSAPYYHLNQEGKTPYTEGLFVGYRGFDAAGIEPAFPFGFGLSYTSFAYSSPKASLRDSGSVDVRFMVANTGKQAGAEIAQVYIVPPPSKERPRQTLAGFARVHLEPGASDSVTVTLAPRAFARWDDGWVIDSGRYGIHIGGSSRDVRLNAAVELEGSKLDL